ncbi:response regulator receiver domain-containing protein [Aliiruegeria haliotis]|uniref:Response regulator receiver domain-containing protein n=1 Tax=Aliiruegeria haliotis TaxID=1280846 RepID=A0A2T0RXS1_9RHOB|nr:response regulator [Aliiruegeria haliotis]PRY25984.1 response regulator receiver domain-containing protein [Aliiruegeria haliotis]
MKVLVVEDDPNLGSLWERVLLEAGHEVLQTASETGAARLLETRPFDLVVLDMCINGRDARGISLLATYRNPTCKVVIVSGSSNFSRKALFAMSPAVSAALRKPVDIEDLLEVCHLVSGTDRRLPIQTVDGGGIEFRT